MTRTDSTRPHAPFRPTGRLSATRGPLHWLLEWPGEAADKVRPAMIGALLSSHGAIVMGAINGMLVAGLALYAIGGLVFALAIAVEAIILCVRLASLKKVNAAHQLGDTPPVDLPITLSILWCSLQGAVFFFCMASGNPAIMVIAAAHCLGLVGPLCARNYPAPRLALLLVGLCFAPMIAGAISTGEPLLLALLALSPGFVLGSSQLIAHYRGAMLSALTAEMANDERARHDPLTGLLNRHGLEGIMQDLPENRPLSLVCFDLDGFKPVNDRFGHAAGDRLLCEVAERMKDALPDGQVLARVGGDEFFAILEDHGPDQTNVAIDEIIARVADTPYAADGTSLVQIGVSAGFACYPEDSMSIAELHILADRALYAAKDAGKGFGTRYTPPLAA